MDCTLGNLLEAGIYLNGVACGRVGNLNTTLELNIDEGQHITADGDISSLSRDSDYEIGRCL